MNREARLKKRRTEQQFTKKSIEKLLWSTQNLITIKMIRSHVKNKMKCRFTMASNKEIFKANKRTEF